MRAVPGAVAPLPSQPMTPATTTQRPRTAPTLRPSLKRNPPGTRNERELWEAGAVHPASQDETGATWVGEFQNGNGHACH